MFNKTNVIDILYNYKRVPKSWEFTPDRVHNTDETGVSTFVQSPNIVAQLGTKQVGQAVSVERGTMITIYMVINSFGNTVPPVFIFPRSKLRDSLMFGAPPGSLQLVNSPQSSCTTGTLFLKVLEHVQKHTSSSKEDITNLLKDNHESFCTLDSILCATENCITLVAFPPQCSHRLLPLDVAVMGPFKGKLRVAQHDWMTFNTGKVTTVHDLA